MMATSSRVPQSAKHTEPEQEAAGQQDNKTNVNNDKIKEARTVSEREAGVANVKTITG